MIHTTLALKQFHNRLFWPRHKHFKPLKHCTLYNKQLYNNIHAKMHHTYNGKHASIFFLRVKILKLHNIWHPCFIAPYLKISRTLANPFRKLHATMPQSNLNVKESCKRHARHFWRMEWERLFCCSYGGQNSHYGFCVALPRRYVHLVTESTHYSE